MRRIVSLMAAGVLPLAAAAQTTAQTRVVVDTDAGSDDIMAIAFLLSRGDVRVEAITVANGLAHVATGARNLARLVALAGRPDLPVYAGRATPLRGANEFPADWRDNTDKLPGVTLPDATRPPQRQPAARFLATWLAAQPASSISILALGPLTNLAEAFARAPAAKAAVRQIVIMGGALRVAGNLGDGGAFRTSNQTAEWNIFVDPLAAQRVFASGVPIRLIPLDATNRVPVGPGFVQEFARRARSPLARLVVEVLTADRQHIEGGYFYAWDPLAAVALVEPAVARFERLRIEVRQGGGEEGRTAEAAGGTPNAEVAVDADAARFRAVFFAALAP